jgi:hypothetical protein
MLGTVVAVVISGVVDDVAHRVGSCSLPLHWDALLPA